MIIPAGYEYYGMNISTMAIGNPPSKKERLHLNALRLNAVNYKVFEMLNGMRRKLMILESLKADQVSEPGHCEELQECSNVLGNVDWFALKIAVLGLVSYVHEPAVCHLPFHLIHSFKNLSLEKILLPKLTLKEKQKKTQKDAPPPTSPIKRPSNIWEFTLPARWRPFDWPCSPCLFGDPRLSIQWFHPKNTRAMILRPFSGREGNFPKWWSTLFGVWEVFCAAPPKTKGTEQRKMRNRFKKNGQSQENVESRSTTPFLGGLKNLFVLGFFSFNRIFKDGETEFIPQEKRAKTLPNFRLDVSIQRQPTGVLVLSDFLWRSVVQQGWVLGLDLVLHKKRCLVQLW